MSRIIIMHDFDLSAVQKGFANLSDAFYLPSFYWMFQKNPREFVQDIQQKGGIKKAYQIPDSVLYEAGADRILIRYPVYQLREAMALGADIIQAYDFSLAEDDSEWEVVAKTATHRDCIYQCDRYLREQKIRDAYMLAGLAHSDHLQGFLEEARFASQYCDIIGVSASAFIESRRYEELKAVLNLIAKEIPKPIQLFGFGASNLRELGDIVKIAEQHKSLFILESSSIIRQSRTRKVLSLKPKSDKLEYKNVQYVKDAENWDPLRCFSYNTETLKGIIKQSTLSYNEGEILGKEALE